MYIILFHLVLDGVTGVLPFLMPGLNSKDVCLKSQKPTTDDLLQVLEDVRLGYVLSRFNGLDSTCEWSCVLSLGEQQRLAFARLLLSKPRLVLLDESTSALDEANEVFYGCLILYFYPIFYAFPLGKSLVFSLSLLVGANFWGHSHLTSCFLWVICNYKDLVELMIWENRVKSLRVTFIVTWIRITIQRQ